MDNNDDLGCALRPDGTFKDASEIEWQYDKDDATPVVAPLLSADSSTVEVASSSTVDVASSSMAKGITSYFLKKVSPAMVVAGSRRSTRTSRPSARAVDPDNAMNGQATFSNPGAQTQGGVRQKRKSASVVLPRRVSRKVVTTDDEDDMRSLADMSNDEGDEIKVIDSGEISDGATEEFESLQAMADADHAAIRGRNVQDSTADLRTIFKRDKEYHNPTTGKVQDGHWCKVCLDDPNTQKSACFLTGSTSTLRMHIARNKNHTVIYLERCKNLGIPTHPRALSRIPVESSDGLQQSSLDSVVTREARQPPFTVNGLLDYIVELIVREDEAFQLVERDSFRGLLRYCRPGISDKDIPRRKTIRAEILRRAQLAEEKVRDRLKELPSKISFTFDAWTSDPGDPYLSITGHYIDAPPNHPQDWELKTDQLAYKTIEGRHTGQNIAKILIDTVDRYKLRGKVGWFTCDGASVNGTTLRELEKLLDERDEGWTAKEHDILCMEHSLHIACKHFVETVAPASPTAIRKKVRAALNKARGSDGDLNLNELDNALAMLDLDTLDSDPDEPDSDDDIMFTAGDALGKALALVKQIRMSPQARVFFKSSCLQVGTQPLELLLWIRTRWASLYRFLDRIIMQRKGVDQFVLLADASDKVPNLSKNRGYADFQLTKKDWDRLEVVRDVLREPSDVQQTFSNEHAPTVWRIIPSLEFLIKRWETMAEQPRFREVKDAINDGITSFKKWYRKVDDTSAAYFICLVLDPNVKDLYCQRRWDPEQYQAGINRLEEVFDEYYRPPESANTSTPSMAARVEATGATAAPTRRYGGSYLLEAVQSFQQEDKASHSPRDELRQYLESGPEPTDNVICWWGHQSDTKYPTLKRIARDYLAIQGSSTPSERAFSSGGITGTARRNRLATEIFEALQILKSAYRSGHIAAVNQAAQHIDALIISLEDMEDV